MKYAWAMALFFTTVAPASDAPKPVAHRAGTALKRYIVHDVNGKIWSWAPWSAHWSPVHVGDRLWESTLVQIGRGSTFTIEVDPPPVKGSIGEGRIQVTLASPIVIRLDDDVLRRVKLSSYFIPEVPEKTGTKDGSSLLYKTLTEAWERFAAVLAKQGIDPSWIDANFDKKGETNVSMRAKPIQVLTPPDGFTAFVDKLPAEVRISWRHIPDPEAHYEIRIWPVQDPRPEPTFATRLDFHNVRFDHEGSYFVQISTKDGKWQSQAHRLFISLPIAGRIAQNKAGTAISALPLPLLLPPRNFNVRVKQFPQWVTFSWDTMTKVPADQSYLFVLGNEQGKTLIKSTVMGKAFQLKFKQPGTFRWYVEAEIQSPKQEGITHRVVSEVRAIRLQYSAPDPLSEFLFAKSSGVLYLEEGL